MWAFASARKFKFCFMKLSGNFLICPWLNLWAQNSRTWRADCNHTVGRSTQEVTAFWMEISREASSLVLVGTSSPPLDLHLLTPQNPKGVFFPAPLSRFQTSLESLPCSPPNASLCEQQHFLYPLGACVTSPVWTFEPNFGIEPVYFIRVAWSHRINKKFQMY